MLRTTFIKDGGITFSVKASLIRKRIVQASYGEGKHRVYCIGIITGKGLIVSVLGGERPHVGAVALGVPRPSLRDARAASATLSVLTLTGHKDDEIARPLAEKFAKRTRQVAVIVVGVHVKRAEQRDIDRLVANADQAAEALLDIICEMRTKD